MLGVSKLSISPIQSQQELSRTLQTKQSQGSQQQRIPSNFLPTPATMQTTVRSFYPTPRPSPKPSQSQSITQQITQHIHVSPSLTIPQLKPHEITLNLPSPDIQRIVQNPSPLLSSQSRVIVTAKASVSDESGRPLNTTQLVTLPLPTIPVSYDDYKEGDESFDPFYRDVPKIRKNRRILKNKNVNVKSAKKKRKRRSLDQAYHFVYDVNSRRGNDPKESESRRNADNVANGKKMGAEDNNRNLWDIKESLMKFRDILFRDEVYNVDSVYSGVAEGIENKTDRVSEEDGNTFGVKSEKQTEDAMKRLDSLKDLKTEAAKHLDLTEEEDTSKEEEFNDEASNKDSNDKTNIEKMVIEKKRVESALKSETKLDFKINGQLPPTAARSDEDGFHESVIDVIIFDNDDDKMKASFSSSDDAEISKADVPIEIIIEKETKSHSQNSSKAMYDEHITRHVTKKVDSVQESRSPTSDATSQSEDPMGKPSFGRKGSRPRSSKRRLSSRVKQQMTDRVETTEAVRQQKEVFQSTTPTTNSTTITTTATNSTTSTTSTTTTTPPPTVPFETQVVVQTDSHIYEELELQTSKEVDTRAIGQHDIMYSIDIIKSIQDDKSHNVSKIEELKRSFDYQIAKDYVEHSKQQDNESEEELSETESPDYTQNARLKDINFTENSRNIEETQSTQGESMEVANASGEKESSVEESSSRVHESTTNDEFDANTNDEMSEEDLEEMYNKISFPQEITVNTKNKTYQEDSSCQEDESEKSSKDDLDEQNDFTTAKDREEASTSEEELNHYQDTTGSSKENARTDASIQEDYKEPESIEYSTVPADYTSSDEYVDLREDVENSTEREKETESSTEGVLKFTDELPGLDHTEDTKAKESVASRPYDINEYEYVDDNYEREDYKHFIFDIKLDDDKEKSNIEKKNQEKEDASATSFERSTEVDDNVEAETHAEHIEAVTELVSIKEIVDSTTTSSTITAASTVTTASTTTPTTVSTTASTIASTTTSTTSSTTFMIESTSMTTSQTTATTTTSTTTPRSTTNISRAMPPKLFKPNSARRTYAYIPPTTTPIPVVIKPRLGLYNPKPAKPPKSYNELAPKPVIRKLPLLSRKPVTTTSTTSTLATTITDKSYPDDQDTTTEPLTTMSVTTAATKAAMTLMATSTTKTTTTTTMTAILTESNRSEENVLKSKVEAKEPLFFNLSAKDNVNKEDQLPSPSEQDSPVNSSRNPDFHVSTEEIQTITPYPLTRISTFATFTEQTAKEAESKLYETTESIDVLTTAAAPTTLPLEMSAYIKTNSEINPKEAESTTTASTKVHPQEVISEILPVLSERPISVLSLTTVPSNAENDYFHVPAESTESTVFRPSSRNTMNTPRKHLSFNCLEKEMYRFYGDTRDCRLFHYCSPGFTKRQVLDFRFVCEKGTEFDEETQSCRHDVQNRKCRNRS
ncbi:PREDICTED: serine-rich adhesin for platelets-like [Dinoponera quadriceps]|uniref:Serine-rich adhesin for platelets-like n=1 Tax=Dinoponera quadriceps TaxID=609295 RepID=A0A6P3X0Q9_DINQU|nr:PREDICTED: serine-rich adhesin for platelets-like [Dinoponera quadriceps]